MSVQISELDVVPRPAPGPQEQAQTARGGGGGGGGGGGAPSPEQAHEIAKTVAILHQRDLRLKAD
jgi:hypothetical protein